MEIKGRVEDIIFHNEENGYTVLNLDADGKLITAVGIFPVVTEGEILILRGEYKTNSRFGEQFCAEYVEISQPDDTMGIFKFLSSGLFKGIGEKLAADLVNKFGMDTLAVLENQPQKLMQVHGIGKKKLQDIIDSYKDTKDMKEAILFLQKHGIAMGTALKIYKKYKSSTESIVRFNPYKMVEDIDGVGFITADKIAKKLGVASDSEFRIKSGIIHSLQESAVSSGHTSLPYNMLLSEAATLLELSTECVDSILSAMTEVRFYQVGEMTYVASRLNFNCENAIAAKLVRLNQTAETWDIDIDTELNNYQKTHNITLDIEQRDAIESVFSNGVSVITGGPGTGKTTIIKGITEILGQQKQKVILCAPTGRASKRITETTNEEAKTIHRLLGMDFSNDGFIKQENNPLEADVVIVDEISMADIYIFNALLKAIPCGARLVLVGDKDQLPSVSCGNILDDIITSGIINVIYLKNIYRQTQNSMIVKNAHNINNGQMPIFTNASDFFMSKKSSNEDILQDIITMTKQRIPKFATVSTQDIQVLAPMKKGAVGVDNINIQLQQALNPNGKQIIHQNRVLKVGDKVMQNVNNYTIAWRKSNLSESGSGVFNGDIGYIVDISNNIVLIEFDDGKLVEYQTGDLEQIMLAYCISVHKSQGSEFPVVILVISGGNYKIMTRNLLYTAVTRARNMVVIIGDENSVAKMIANNYTAKRFSLLKELLLQNKQRLEQLWGQNED